MYYCTESDLNIKSVGQLKDVYRQIGCTEVLSDKRVKANWVEAILTHQSAQVTKFSGWISKNKSEVPQIPATVQSGLLIFKPIGSASAKSSHQSTLELCAPVVWNGEINYGVIRMLVDGLWVHACFNIQWFSFKLEGVSSINAPA